MTKLLAEMAAVATAVAGAVMIHPGLGLMTASAVLVAAIEVRS